MLNRDKHSSNLDLKTQTIKKSTFAYSPEIGLRNPTTSSQIYQGPNFTAIIP